MPYAPSRQKIQFSGYIVRICESAAKPSNVIHPLGLAALAAYHTDYGTTNMFRSANNPMAVLADNNWTGEVYKMSVVHFDHVAGWQTTILLFKKYPTHLAALQDFTYIVNSLLNGGDHVKLKNRLQMCCRNNDVNGWVAAILTLYGNPSDRYIGQVQHCAKMIRANSGGNK